MIASVLGLRAQTDVTSDYVVNPGFESCTARTDNLAAAGSAAGDNYADAGWTLAQSAAWSSSAVVAYGGSGQVNGASAPSADNAGNGGNALGVSVGWSGINRYLSTTAVTLPAGHYVLTINAYNNLSGVTQFKSLNGFVPTSGSSYLSTKTSFAYATWVTDVITFDLTEATEGKFQIGGQAISGGSGSNAKVFFDNITLVYTDPLQASKTALQAEIDKAKLCDAKEGLASAIATAEDALANATTQAELEQALADLQAADKDAVLRYENSLADASATNGMLTGFVVNGTFDNGISGWSRTGSFQNNQTANNKQGDFTGNFYENWNGSAQVNKMYQTISNVPNGTYKLRIAAFMNTLTDPNQSQYVFANSDKTYLTTAEPTFYEVWTVVTNNTIEIGLEQTTATANWMGLDNVSLTYYGAGDVISQAQAGAYKVDWDEAVANAQAALANSDYANVTGKERADLQAELAKAEPTTAQGYNDATAALRAATNAFTAAKANYDLFVQYNTTLEYADASKKPVISETTTAATIIPDLRAYYESNALAEGVTGAVNMTSSITNATDPTNNDGWTWTGNKNNPASNEPWTDANGTSTHSYFDGGNWGAQTWTTTMEQTIEIPAGKYLLTAKARAAANVTFTMEAAGMSVNLPHVGNTGNLFDRGWGDASLYFETSNRNVTIKVTASTNTLHEWFSISDFRLIQLEEIVPDAYTVGDATVDMAYIQPGQTVTVTFGDAYTTDDNATLTQDYSSVTLDGAALAITSGEKGFSFTVPSLEPAGEYTLVIPAYAIGYADGNTYNTEQTFTLKTPAVFDGEYCLYDEANGLFLGRGNEWGTEASADKYGIPFNLTTDATGASSIEFVDWPGVYLFLTGTAIYTDNASTGWSFVPADGGYKLCNVGQTAYATHSAGTFGEYVHTTTDASAATVWTLKSKAERDAIIAAYPTDNIQNVIDATNIETTAADFKSYLSSNFRSKDFTSSIGTARFAGNAGNWTWTGTSRTQNGQPAYGTDFAEVWNATGAYTQTISGLMEGIYRLTVQGYERRKDNDAATALYNDGYNLVSTFMSANGEQVRFTDWNDVDGKPTNTGGAVAAFNNGKAVNELYVYLNGSEDLTITIRKPNYIWDCWTIFNNFTLTRYYTEDFGGLDEEDIALEELIESLQYTAGDFDGNGVDGTDVETLANILVGKTTEYNDKVADVNGVDGVTLADLTQLVNVVNGTAEARIVDETYTYADVNATVYAEQNATENAEGANYTIDSAVCTLTKEDVSDKVDMKDYLTTLNISVSLSNVKSVSVYAKGKENIAGVMSVALRGEEAPAITYSAGTTPNAYVNNDRTDVASGMNMYSDVVTVTGNDAGTYVAYLLPVALNDGVTVTVRDNNGKFYSQDFSVEAGQENDLTFTETTATNNWMATIPGNVNFSMISTPGAHDSATSGVTSYTNLSKCQNEDIAGLLTNGVRAFDIRPGYYYTETITENNLYIYHGQVSTNVLYKDAMKVFADFLAANPSEAIAIIMVKENCKPTTDLFNSWTDRSNEMWSVINAVHATYGSYMKVLDHSYYTLDDFRGKMCYINRTGTSVPSTTQITNWPDDNSVINYNCKIGNTCSASVEDAYNTSGDSKKAVVNALLDLASANTDRSRFHYTFTSVANSITNSANTQNPAAAQYISGTLTGPTGYVYADFMGSSSYSGQALLKAVIEQNYKYVNKGRSRCE